MTAGPFSARTRWCTGSSGRRWTTRIPPEVDGRRRWQSVVSAAATGTGEYRRGSNRGRSIAGRRSIGRPAGRRSAGPSPRPASRRRGRAAVDELDGVAMAEPRVRTAPSGSDRMAHRLEALEEPRPEAGLGADRVRRREVLLRLDEPARHADGRRDVEPPSTSADTTWAWICGWASPPIEPVTTHGRPSRKSIPGMSVCSVRFRGARTLGWSVFEAEVTSRGSGSRCPSRDRRRPTRSPRSSTR